MKRLFILFFILNLFSGKAIAQKKIIDHNTYANWPNIDGVSINANGSFVRYYVDIPGKGSQIIVESMDLSWKKVFSALHSVVFANEGHQLIFLNYNDSLGILKLGTDSIKYISQVSNYLVSASGSDRYMVYQKQDSEKTFVCIDLKTGAMKQYPGIKNFVFNSSGENLVLVKDSSEIVDVLWLSLANNDKKTICHSCNFSGFSFDEKGTGLAFLQENKANGQVLSIRYFKEGMDSAAVLVDHFTAGMKGMGINKHHFFLNKSGDRILFNIEHEPTKIINSVSDMDAHVTIRGKHDIKDEHALAKGPFVATMDLSKIENGVIRLQQETEKGCIYLVDGNSEWVVTESNIGGNPLEGNWDTTARPDIYLVSTRDGSRRLIKKRLHYVDMYFSPSGKYLIWFDQQEGRWFSYNIQLNRTRDISADIVSPVWENIEYPGIPSAFPIGGWLKNDKGVLIQDRHDIWSVDLNGIRAPVNLTNGYGAINKIRFRNINIQNNQPFVIGSNDTLLLSAFNLITKEDGFFCLNMATKHLQQMTMSNHIYTFHGDDFCGVRHPGILVKAKNADIYILPRMSATDYPNWYVTRDFRNFNPLTDFAPQKDYNWYTTELVHWKLPNGRPDEGILFKPENFDPNRKYPIIFYYYEKCAFNLNIFIHPALSSGPLNIPWFLSNGYLVFVPDIYYTMGYPGRSAANSVVSAAEYLSRMPWVDSRRMGLQGHSFGGFETNYIVSHSNLFVAAAPASAMADQISAYGETGRTFFFENEQGRIGFSPWQRLDYYLENSPVIRADKVSAAILIMDTEDDTAVPYLQGVEWFNALRRLGKRVWFLSYKGESHVLGEEKNKLDYSIRLGQFFDHYLKNAPAPKWMTQGGTSLELDSSAIKTLNIR